MNITLIGMAGAGKSKIGKRLAERLGLQCIDIDDVLAETHGKGIQSILDEVGEEEYLRREEEALISATAGKDGILISPGGSVIYRDGGMDHIKNLSTVVYLKAPFETIEERLRDAPPRAIIGLGRKSLRELYDERHPLYERYADITVEAGKDRSKETIESIIEYLSGKTDAQFPANVSFDTFA